MTGVEIINALRRQTRQFPLQSIGVMIDMALLLVLIAAIAKKDYRSRIKRWFLLTGNRWTVTGVLVSLVFLISVILGITPLVHIAEQRFSTAIFSAIISGLLSLVPIVITVNQLTISQLFATPEQLRQKIQNVQSFRTDIEKQLPEASVAPTDPDAFLLEVNDLIAERAATIRDAAANDTGPEADYLADYSEKILTETNERAVRVTTTHTPLIEILVPIMDDEHAKNINITRSIRKEHPEAISHRTKTVLDELEDLFLSMDVIRQYFKALYIQEALANLSKLIAYTGAGAFVLSMFAVMIFVGKKPLPLSSFMLQTLLSLAIALSFVPVAILVAYVARIGTIVKHTVAPGAFTPKKGTFSFID